MSAYALHYLPTRNQSIVLELSESSKCNMCCMHLQVQGSTGLARSLDAPPKPRDFKAVRLTEEEIHIPNKLWGLRNYASRLIRSPDFALMSCMLSRLLRMAQ